MDNSEVKLERLEHNGYVYILMTIYDHKRNTIRRQYLTQSEARELNNALLNRALCDC